MADTTISYPGDGTQRDFSVPFPYLDKSHVKVLVNEVAVPFTWLNATQVRLATAPPTGHVVRIYRDTPTDQRIVEFQNGSAFSDEQLNVAVQQCFFISQEAADKISGTNLPLIEAERIAAEAAADDAATQAAAAAAARSGAEAAKVGAESAASSAATAATAAVNSTLDAKVTAAQTAKAGAETARTGAESARDAAVAAVGTFDGTAYLRKDDNLASVVDKDAARANIGAAVALGFTPVQQGGGAGQTTNKVYIGWSGTQLKAQVDSTDLGVLWSNYAASASLAASGYQKFPSGLILQWGRGGSSGYSGTITLPVAFPTGLMAVVGTVISSDGASLYSVQLSSPTTTSFNFIKKYQNAATTANQTSAEIFWIAVGY